MKRTKDKDEQDPILCLEYMELNIGRIPLLVAQVDARAGGATGARRLLRHLLGLLSTVAKACLAGTFEGQWRDRARDLLRSFAPYKDDLRRLRIEVPPEVDLAMHDAAPNA